MSIIQIPEDVDLFGEDDFAQASPVPVDIKTKKAAPEKEDTQLKNKKPEQTKEDEDSVKKKSKMAEDREIRKEEHNKEESYLHLKNKKVEQKKDGGDTLKKKSKTTENAGETQKEGASSDVAEKKRKKVATDDDDDDDEGEDCDDTPSPSSIELLKLGNFSLRKVVSVDNKMFFVLTDFWKACDNSKSVSKSVARKFSSSRVAFRVKGRKLSLWTLPVEIFEKLWEYASTLNPEVKCSKYTDIRNFLLARPGNVDNVSMFVTQTNKKVESPKKKVAHIVSDEDDDDEDDDDDDDEEYYEESDNDLSNSIQFRPKSRHDMTLIMDNVLNAAKTISDALSDFLQSLQQFRSEKHTKIHHAKPSKRRRH